MIARNTPPREVWIEAATQEARRSRVQPSLVMAGGLGDRVVRARWRAWRRVKDADPGYSLAGIGRISGFHHTTVRYSILRDRGEEEKIAYKFKRKPKGGSNDQMDA